MKQQAKWMRLTGACMLVAGLAGCAGQTPTSEQQPSEPLAAPVSPETPPSALGQPSQPGTGSATDWVPPLFISPEEEAAYYVSRLADRRFVSSYGDRDNPRTWYIAAERLGEIGKPAVPLLFARLNTQDEYELMLALYALQLATQDTLLMARTRGDYVQLTTTLDPAGNAENTQIARQWWQQHAAQLDSP
ncbi:MAG: hypothetical protein IKE45_13480 [Halomonas sp.]|nr:hypothetical protein [Halomonas sp.]MBR2514991.1 hypothetical protein [Halomonas sp.]